VAAVLARHIGSATTTAAVCDAIRLLAAEESNRSLLADARVLSSLLAVPVKHETDDLVVEQALLALNNMADNESRRQTLVSEGAIPQLLGLLERRQGGNSWKVVDVACRLTSKLACSEENRVALAKEGAVPVVMGVFRHFADKPSVMEAACIAVGYLALNIQIRSALLEVGILTSIGTVVTTHKGDHTTIKEACRALRSLMATSEEIRSLKIVTTLNDEQARALVAVLQNYAAPPTLSNAAVLEQACGALNAMTANTNNHQPLAKADIFKPLVNLLVNYRDHAAVMEQAYWIVSDLALDNVSTNPMQLSKAGVWPPAVDALAHYSHRHDSSTLRAVSCAVRNLASKDEIQTYLAPLDLLKELCRNLVQVVEKNNDPKVIEQALWALKFIATTSNNQKALDVAIPVLAKQLMTSTTPSVLTALCSLINNLANNPTNRAQFAKFNVGPVLISRLSTHLNDNRVVKGVFAALNILTLNDDVKAALPTDSAKVVEEALRIHKDKHDDVAEQGRLLLNKLHAPVRRHLDHVS
jgi:hypothetical protein